MGFSWSKWFGRRAETTHQDSFCVYPLLEQVALPTGTIGFCCVAKEGGPIYKSDGSVHKIPKDSLKEAWNSDFLRQVRKDQAKGKAVKNCELCYYQERIGKKSYRQSYNEEWMERAPVEISERRRQVAKNDGVLSGGPMHLDLRLGNLCNLKCRMCNPYNSSKIEAEFKGLVQTDSEFRSFYRENHSGHFPKTTKWYEDEKFWEGVEQVIPTLKKVYLTGGEPTLIRKNTWFLKRCIEIGRASSMDLMFNINGTHLPEEFLQLIQKFHHVLINVSIDGAGKANDYIRSGSQWENVTKNLRKLLAQPKNIQVGVTPVIQVYNILNIDRLLIYIDALSSEFDREINVDLLYATEPSYLDIRFLPESIKQQAKQKLKSCETLKLFKRNFYFKNSIQSCLQSLTLAEPQHAQSERRKFVNFTRLLDRSRKESWEESLPDLYEAFLREGLL